MRNVHEETDGFKEKELDFSPKLKNGSQVKGLRKFFSTILLATLSGNAACFSIPLEWNKIVLPQESDMHKKLTESLGNEEFSSYEEFRNGQDLSINLARRQYYEEHGEDFFKLPDIYVGNNFADILPDEEIADFTRKILNVFPIPLRSKSLLSEIVFVPIVDPKREVDKGHHIVLKNGSSKIILRPDMQNISAFLNIFRKTLPHEIGHEGQCKINIQFSPEDELIFCYLQTKFATEQGKALFPETESIKVHDASDKQLIDKKMGEFFAEFFTAALNIRGKDQQNWEKNVLHHLVTVRKADPKVAQTEVQALVGYFQNVQNGFKPWEAAEQIHKIVDEVALKTSTYFYLQAFDKIKDKDLSEYFGELRDEKKLAAVTFENALQQVLTKKGKLSYKKAETEEEKNERLWIQQWIHCNTAVLSSREKLAQSSVEQNPAEFIETTLALLNYSLKNLETSFEKIPASRHDTLKKLMLEASSKAIAISLKKNNKTGLN